MVTLFNSFLVEALRARLVTLRRVTVALGLFGLLSIAQAEPAKPGPDPPRERAPKRAEVLSPAERLQRAAKAENEISDAIIAAVNNRKLIGLAPAELSQAEQDLLQKLTQKQLAIAEEIHELHLSRPEK